MTDVVVVGGGIAGLAAADRLAHAGVEVTLLEAAQRLGGNMYTAPFSGRWLDLGAEAIVTRDPVAIDLCRELSLDAQLVTPASSRSFVWTGPGLRPLPADAIARMPGRFGGVLRSRLLSPLGVLRLGWDVIAPSHAPHEDVAIGAIVRSRLGGEVLERIVDPLLGGVHAGRCDALSAQALAPQLIRALQAGNGLMRGLRAAQTSTSSAGATATGTHQPRSGLHRTPERAGIAHRRAGPARAGRRRQRPARHARDGDPGAEPRPLDRRTAAGRQS